MIIDSSALMAAIKDEPEADRFTQVIIRAEQGFVSAVTLLETSMVRAGRDAFLHHGKGRHEAALNLGDCASYAFATTRNLPLLFKENDFARTDLTQAA